MAFDFKEKFDRSGVSSLSAPIEIDRSIFLESAISTAPSTWPKTTVSLFVLAGETADYAAFIVSGFGWRE